MPYSSQRSKRFSGPLALLFCCSLLLAVGAPRLALAGTLADRLCAVTENTVETPLCTEGGDAVSWLDPITAQFVGARSDTGRATIPFDVPGVPSNLRIKVCRYVDNATNSAFFVPFYSAVEWSSFIRNVPSGIHLKWCSRATQMILRPDARCMSPVPASQTVALPYARAEAGVTETRNVSFTCKKETSQCASNKDATWTETVTATYGADIRSPDEVNPISGWVQKSVVYGGDPGGACTAGVCGSAINSTTKPTSGFCVEPSTLSGDISGNGPWTWTCAGSNGGTSVSCKASPNAQDGVCGPAVDSTTKPTSGFCVEPSTLSGDISGNGPWTWICAGTNGGAPVTCEALAGAKDGQCGPAVSSMTKPTSGFCVEPSVLSGDVSGDGPWTWTCSGTNGGNAVSCRAMAGAKDGQCGPAVSSTTKPTSGFCVEPSTLSGDVSGTGPWQWTCAGVKGGNSVACRASPAPQNGECGTDNGGSFYAATPPVNLCKSPSTLSGSLAGTGPWSWTCAGTNGGTSASCGASLKKDGVCNTAVPASSSAPSGDSLCVYTSRIPPVSGGSSAGKWTWTCYGLNGGNDSPVCSSPYAAPPLIECTKIVTSMENIILTASQLQSAYGGGFNGNVSYKLIGGGGGGASGGFGSNYTHDACPLACDDQGKNCYLGLSDGGGGGSSALLMNNQLVAVASGGSAGRNLDSDHKNKNTDGRDGQTISGAFTIPNISSGTNNLKVYAGGGGGGGGGGLKRRTTVNDSVVLIVDPAGGGGGGSGYYGGMGGWTDNKAGGEGGVADMDNGCSMGFGCAGGGSGRTDVPATHGYGYGGRGSSGGSGGVSDGKIPTCNGTGGGGGGFGANGGAGGKVANSQGASGNSVPNGYNTNSGHGGTTPQSGAMGGGGGYGGVVIMTYRAPSCFL